MDFKSPLMDALSRLQALTLEGSAEWNQWEQERLAAEQETDPRVLWEKGQYLREMLAKLATGKDEAPFKTKLPSGEIRGFKNLKELKDYQKDIGE